MIICSLLAVHIEQYTLYSLHCAIYIVHCTTNSEYIKVNSRSFTEHLGTPGTRLICMGISFVELWPTFTTAECIYTRYPDTRHIHRIHLLLLLFIITLLLFYPSLRSYELRRFLTS